MYNLRGRESNRPSINEYKLGQLYDKMQSDRHNKKIINEAAKELEDYKPLGTKEESLLLVKLLSPNCKFIECATYENFIGVENFLSESLAKRLEEKLKQRFLNEPLPREMGGELRQNLFKEISEILSNKHLHIKDAELYTSVSNYLLEWSLEDGVHEMKRNLLLLKEKEISKFLRIDKKSLVKGGKLLKVLNSEISDRQKSQLIEAITEHILSYKYYPDHYTCALLAKRVYINHNKEHRFSENWTKYMNGVEEDRKEHFRDIFTKWKILGKPEDDTNSGYYGTIYVNYNEKQMVVAHRGTESKFKKLDRSIKDLGADLSIAMQQKVLPQFSSALELTHKAVEFIKNNNEYNGYSLTTTGHSLGGCLSQRCALALYQEDIILHTVTFDSPGIWAVFNEINPDNPDREIDKKKLDIIEYFYAPNFINAKGRHIGQINRIISYIEGGVSSNISSWETHRLIHFLNSFNERTGMPIEYVIMHNWPSSVGDLRGLLGRLDENRQLPKEGSNGSRDIAIKYSYKEGLKTNDENGIIIGERLFTRIKQLKVITNENFFVAKFIIKLVEGFHNKFGTPHEGEAYPVIKPPQGVNKCFDLYKIKETLDYILKGISVENLPGATKKKPLAPIKTSTDTPNSAQPGNDNDKHEGPSRNDSKTEPLDDEGTSTSNAHLSSMHYCTRIKYDNNLLSSAAGMKFLSYVTKNHGGEAANKLIELGRDAEVVEEVLGAVRKQGAMPVANLLLGINNEPTKIGGTFLHSGRKEIVVYKVDSNSEGLGNYIRSLTNQAFKQIDNLLDKKLSWNIKCLLNSQQINKFGKLLEHYGIDEPTEILQASPSDYKKKIALKLHPDKGGKHEDFIFAQTLYKALNKELDVNKALESANQGLHKIAYYNRVADIWIDAIRAFKEPTATNIGKIGIQAITAYSMISSNLYSALFSSAGVGYSIYQAEYYEAFKQGFFAVAPLVLTYANPALGLLYSSVLTTHSIYATAHNGYSLVQEFLQEDSIANSKTAYLNLFEGAKNFLSHTPLNYFYEFDNLDKGYNDQLTIAESKLEKHCVGVSDSKLCNVYERYINEKDIVKETTANRQEARDTLKAGLINEENYQLCLESVTGGMNNDVESFCSTFYPAP